MWLWLSCFSFSFCLNRGQISESNPRFWPLISVRMFVIAVNIIVTKCYRYPLTSKYCREMFALVSVDTKAIIAMTNNLDLMTDSVYMFEIHISMLNARTS